jgi:hypothetical protein
MQTVNHFTDKTLLRVFWMDGNNLAHVNLLSGRFNDYLTAKPIKL